ncbi:LD-carboxypeptidase [[Mycoplasma] falconis]|uniref:LD-carboxypeptidase n=1 Tax=[Mycoplasma] falconis TaxID=92403 RepID=A0A501XC26_9BACT|nr:S66 peptidase family protein [[Mycoplasma] falconis]TPE57989.1 LD-carboxypeptidase [[Mycoplasma] falconis]
MKINKNDLIAIISLSDGMLGEDFAKHEVELANKRIKEFNLNFIYTLNALKGRDFICKNPDKRAQDLIWAFNNQDVKAIISAIGGFDTFKTLPFILDNPNYIKLIKDNLKPFIGYSDTTINHLMFNHLGLPSYYGICVATDLAELDKEMLPYTKQSFLNLFEEKEWAYTSSDIWYNEREDFSINSLNKPRESFKEQDGFIEINVKEDFEGILIGGCVESINELIVGEEFKQEVININKKYHLFDDKTDFTNRVLLLETSEARITPEKLEEMLNNLATTGVFNKINGILFGKPQNNTYIYEYKAILEKLAKKYDLPIVYNINIGHAYPKMLLKLNANVKYLKDKKMIISDNK